MIIATIYSVVGAIECRVNLLYGFSFPFYLKSFSVKMVFTLLKHVFAFLISPPRSYLLSLLWL